MTVFGKRETFVVGYLHPEMVGPITLLINTMRTIERGRCVLAPFEGFRHPGRQAHLLASGKVTKAGPWQSDHQYGLAVDFAGLRVENNMVIPNSWTWDDVPQSLWSALKREAIAVGLDVPIRWDKGHVAHPLGAKFRSM